ncbi:hypothetical protein [Phocaeicola plebeius]|uniref:hypothetical protein n=1 Tax=Phocaeicola plebeius TaxID=310297 RepID=UPI0040273EBD
MAIQRELWQNTIIEGLFADNSFMSKAVNDDMYVNMGKKVHIPNAGAPSAVEIDRSSLPATVKTRTDVDVEYSLNELTTDPIRIPHAETVELSYSKRNSVISQDRLQLIEKAAEQMLYNWAPDSSHFVRTTGTEKVKAHTESATGYRKALVKADVLALMTKFNADNIPQEGRYLLLDAYMYAQLLDDLTEGDQRAFFASADAQRGILGKLFSFNVMQRSQVLRYATGGTLKKWSVSGATSDNADGLVSGATSDNAAGLAWQTNSLSRALGEVKMFDSTDNPLYYGDIYSFLIRVGGTIRRKDKKGVYALVQDEAGE